MPRQTPHNPPDPTPQTVAKPAAKPAVTPLNRWAGVTAMSGFFRSGDPLLDLRDCLDRMFDSVFGTDLMAGCWSGRAELPPRSGRPAVGVTRVPSGRDAV